MKNANRTFQEEHAQVVAKFAENVERLKNTREPANALVSSYSIKQIAVAHAAVSRAIELLEK